MLTWHKDLTDYGSEALTRYTSGAGQQYSADHNFQTGTLAMMIEGAQKQFIEGIKFSGVKG